ncbi:uncharacterized protein EI97DRAFT_244502 [Westerdykella ornata]|uniref:C2H2-type domain-containing protein n=1 Tax=Westerdykella ornata TaxID=318751 RepID=A0A6A6J9D0_WESOR|nr:uncharacterized protein EI97DRAFT_244502 [Westerdykella ornata]KAF2271829.1 hypothetical protein EI97DRAFT_244502 [Westerdykella ornata]
MDSDLRQAINTADIQTLRSALYEILKTVPGTSNVVKKKMGRPTASRARAESINRERERAVYYCSRCEQYLKGRQVLRNQCFYHPGKLQIKSNPTAWPDWQDDEEINMELNKQEFPECFFWTCCGEEGDGKKWCVQRRHPLNMVARVELDGE